MRETFYINNQIFKVQKKNFAQKLKSEPDVLLQINKADGGKSCDFLMTKQPRLKYFAL